mgnify:CR=1 FL=1
MFSLTNYINSILNPSQLYALVAYAVIPALLLVLSVGIAFALLECCAIARKKGNSITFDVIADVKRVHTNSALGRSLGVQSKRKRIWVGFVADKPVCYKVSPKCEWRKL